MTPSPSSAQPRAAVAEPAWEELRGILGADHLRPAESGDAICRQEPHYVAEPADEKQLAAALRWANEAGVAVTPRGSGSKLDWGNAPARLDLILSTARLDRIVEHVWSDMTVIVEAGVTIRQLQRALGEHGQRLAIDPLWPERATIGGILSTNDSGTLRLRFGALRDLIIGVTLALPDGTLAKSGGKVVKNVAGYDLPKLATGALGTLGVITQAAFRLHPVPRGMRSLCFQAAGAQDAQRLILAFQDSQLAHTSLQARVPFDGPPRVDLRLEGTTAGIEAQSAIARKLAAGVKEEDCPADAWDARQRLWEPAGGAALVKFSVLPSRISAACEAFRREGEKAGMRWTMVVQGTGLGWARLEDMRPEALRSAILTLRRTLEGDTGSLAALERPAGLADLDAWGSAGDSYPVMVRVKQQFDPRGTLNPGRFVGGI
ncbi:MAG TPA: FAD-binding oxidoreductase [Candidatus Binatia bacterium]|nr:FAD-binding oxidoreductase [Candidatus Binatia bacterium]